jgi:hypothetical protein
VRRQASNDSAPNQRPTHIEGIFGLDGPNAWVRAERHQLGDTIQQPSRISKRVLPILRRESEGRFSARPQPFPLRGTRPRAGRLQSWSAVGAQPGPLGEDAHATGLALSVLWLRCDEVRDLGQFSCVQTGNRVLNGAVGFRHALVLTQVLEPAI